MTATRWSYRRSGVSGALTRSRPVRSQAACHIGQQSNARPSPARSWVRGLGMPRVSHAAVSLSRKPSAGRSDSCSGDSTSRMARHGDSGKVGDAEGQERGGQLPPAPSPSASPIFSESPCRAHARGQDVDVHEGAPSMCGVSGLGRAGTRRPRRKLPSDASRSRMR